MAILNILTVLQEQHHPNRSLQRLHKMVVRNPARPVPSMAL